MRIAITGSSGLVGTALTDHLRRHGHEITRLVRHETPAYDEIRWDPALGLLPTAALSGIGAVIHLAGENPSGRWNEQRKDLIRSSRVRGTKLLAERLATMTDGPRTLVCASAVGYYGDRGGELLTEECGPGSGFLASVHCAAEEAAHVAGQADIRVVHVRTGIVQTPTGGALGEQLPLFRRGLGARIGKGDQYISWISILDLVRVFEYALHQPELYGPLNAVAPHPVTNTEYARTLARVLRRPQFLALPRVLLRHFLGEFAEEVLLSSTRATPRRLTDSGFAFRYPQLEGALRQLCLP